MATVTKAPKTVNIVDRKVVDAHTVIYTVRSSRGDATYETTIIDGKARGCTCPAHVFCYHETQLQEKEEEIAKATLPLMSTPEMKELIADLEESLGLKQKKVRRSAKNDALVASLQLPEGVKVRKVRGQYAIKVVAPQEDAEMIQDVPAPVAEDKECPRTATNAPISDATVTDECPVIVSEADISDVSVQEHHLFQDLARYEHSLDNVSLKGLLQDADRAGLSVSDRRVKAAVLKALIDHKRSLLEKQHLGEDKPVIDGSKPVPQAQKFSNQQRRDNAALGGTRGFGSVLLYSRR